VTSGNDERPTAPACDACPLGFLADVLRDAQPEATLHLLAATSELLLALETVVRAAEQRLERQATDAGEAGQADDGKPSRIRHIDIA
jgi:hypothetical protein